MRSRSYKINLNSEANVKFVRFSLRVPRFSARIETDRDRRGEHRRERDEWQLIWFRSRSTRLNCRAVRMRARARAHVTRELRSTCAGRRDFSVRFILFIVAAKISSSLMTARPGYRYVRVTHNDLLSRQARCCYRGDSGVSSAWNNECERASQLLVART